MSRRPVWLLCGYLVWGYLGGHTCAVLWACVPCVRVKFGDFVIRIGEGQQQTFLNLFLFFKACQPWAKAPNVMSHAVSALWAEDSSNHRQHPLSISPWLPVSSPTTCMRAGERGRMS